jgi:hypothetical protein
MPIDLNILDRLRLNDPTLVELDLSSQQLNLDISSRN